MSLGAREIQNCFPVCISVFSPCTSLQIHLSFIDISCNKTPHTTTIPLSLQMHHTSLDDSFLRSQSNGCYIMLSIARLNKLAPLAPWQPCRRPNLLELNVDPAAQSPPPSWQTPPPPLPCAGQSQTKNKLAKARQGAGDH